MVQEMSLFDMIFWLLIVLIAVLAYSIESGLSARHRTIILSSILSATVAAIFMMFLIEDHSSFGTGDPIVEEEGKKKIAGGGLRPGGGGGGETEIEEKRADEGGDGGGGITVNRYADADLLNQPGGFRDCPVCPLMIMVDAGHVVMGSPVQEPDRRANEGPQKRINFARAFTVSRYEILINEFQAFVEETGHTPSRSCIANGEARSDLNWLNPGFDQPTGDRPVVCITSSDAHAYARWLTRKTDRTYRLLSESEWEYVARAGSITPYWTGPKIGSDEAYFAATEPGSVRAGRYKANDFKLFDVAGNVWEMTADCWLDDLENVSAFGSPSRPAGICATHPVRGGGWDSRADQLRSAYRREMPREKAFNTVGLRIARELK